MSATDSGRPEGAYAHWDRQWRTEAGRLEWSTPEPWVLEVMDQARAAGGTRALDVGCGIGRHTQALAEAGFEAHGVDRSEAGLAHARRLAAAAGIEVHLRHTDFHTLPYGAQEFDYVLAWNVVYHGTEGDLSAALSEILRVLRPGGLYQATMLSKRNGGFGKGIEISPNTFVQPEATDDKVHPHLYCHAADIARLHGGWHQLQAFEATQGTPGSYHWNLLYQRPGLDAGPAPRRVAAKEADHLPG